jgi:hypothetical protein
LRVFVPSWTMLVPIRESREPWTVARSVQVWPVALAALKKSTEELVAAVQGAC